MPRVEELTERYLGISRDVGEKILATVALVVGYLIIRRIARRLVLRVGEAQSRFQLNRALAYSLGVVGLLALLKIWVSGITGLATYLGLVSAGLAVALQDPLINFAGWLFILVRRPFQVGDRVQIGPHAGDVVDVRLFRFLVLEIGQWVKADQSTGRLLNIPNGWVFKYPIANYDGAFGYIWNELEVVVTYESDWKKAREILEKTVAEHAEHLSQDAVKRLEEAAEHFHIKFSKVTPVVWTAVEADGVRLTMRYLCKPRERRSSASAIWEALLDELAKTPEVELAYRTTRVVGEASATQRRGAADVDSPTA